MLRSARLLSLVAVLGAAGTLGACGSGGEDTITIGVSSGGTTSTAPGGGTPQGPVLPRGVPAVPSGRPVDAVSRRVIRKWLGALRAGDIPRAARFFALPSQVSNGTPIATLRTARDRVAFNDALTCGARATRIARAARGFTLVDFVLTERPGGACGTGVGGSARCVIRVVDGHIKEWYRLPDPAPPRDPGTGGGSLA